MVSAVTAQTLFEDGDDNRLHLLGGKLMFQALKWLLAVIAPRNVRRLAGFSVHHRLIESISVPPSDGSIRFKRHARRLIITSRDGHTLISNQLRAVYEAYGSVLSNISATMGTEYAGYLSHSKGI